MQIYANGAVRDDFNQRAKRSERAADTTKLSDLIVKHLIILLTSCLPKIGRILHTRTSWDSSSILREHVSEILSFSFQLSHPGSFSLIELQHCQF